MRHLHPRFLLTTPTRRERSTIRVTALLGAIGFILVNGCTEKYRFHNVAPLISSLGPICVDPDDRAHVLISLVDFEGDAVDVTFEWSADGQMWNVAPLAPAIAEETLTPARCGDAWLEQDWTFPVGFGQVGLASERQPPGALHVLVLDAKEWQAFAEVVLRATPDDRQGSPGMSLATPFFGPNEGIDAIAIPNSTNSP